MAWSSSKSAYVQAEELTDMSDLFRNLDRFYLKLERLGLGTNAEGEYQESLREALSQLEDSIDERFWSLPAVMSAQCWVFRLSRVAPGLPFGGMQVEYLCGSHIPMNADLAGSFFRVTDFTGGNSDPVRTIRFSIEGFREDQPKLELEVNLRKDLADHSFLIAPLMRRLIYGCPITLWSRDALAFRRRISVPGVVGDFDLIREDVERVFCW